MDPRPARGGRALSTIAAVRRSTFLLAVALGACVTAAPPAVALPDSARIVEVASGNAHVRAFAISTCVQTLTEDGQPGGASCSQAARRARGGLRIRGGARVRMLFGATPSQVKWRLLSGAGADASTLAADRAHRKKERKRRFVFHLPRRLPCATVLEVAATFREGERRTDMDYLVGVRPRSCRR